MRIRRDHLTWNTRIQQTNKHNGKKTCQEKKQTMNRTTSHFLILHRGLLPAPQCLNTGSCWTLPSLAHCHRHHQLLGKGSTEIRQHCSSCSSCQTQKAPQQRAFHKPSPPAAHRTRLAQKPRFLFLSCGVFWGFGIISTPWKLLQTLCVAIGTDYFTCAALLNGQIG